jgi:hypothetical protein
VEASQKKIITIFFDTNSVWLVFTSATNFTVFYGLLLLMHLKILQSVHVLRIHDWWIWIAKGIPNRCEGILYFITGRLLLIALFAIFDTFCL